MNSKELFYFAVAFLMAILFLLWRLMRAEEGHGFIPMSKSTQYAVMSTFFGVLSFAFFAMAAMFLAIAMAGK